MRGTLAASDAPFSRCEGSPMYRPVLLNKHVSFALISAVSGLACWSAPVLAQEEPQSLGELVVSSTALKVEAPLVETPRAAL